MYGGCYAQQYPGSLRQDSVFWMLALDTLDVEWWQREAEFCIGTSSCTGGCWVSRWVVGHLAMWAGISRSSTETLGQCWEGKYVWYGSLTVTEVRQLENWSVIDNPVDNCQLWRGICSDWFIGGFGVRNILLYLIESTFAKTNWTNSWYISFRV